ncbi:MAG: serine hydrolase, partial [Planctomycetota bacterium]
CRPGGNARGPVRDLANFYTQLLCDRGDFPPHLACNGERFLSEQTAQQFTSRQRVGLRDKTFGDTPIDWGFGFLMTPDASPTPRVPYGYGPHASPDTFGHSGNQLSCAFADPVAGLVVVWCTNGQPGELVHQRRQRAINTAIYEDLGLAR